MTDINERLTQQEFLTEIQYFCHVQGKKRKKKIFKANLAKDYHKPIFIIVVNRFSPNLKTKR